VREEGNVRQQKSKRDGSLSLGCAWTHRCLNTVFW
jgi:hypothetical protein